MTMSNRFSFDLIPACCVMPLGSPGGIAEQT